MQDLIRAEVLLLLEVWADETMARVPKMAPGEFPSAHDSHCCPKYFISIALPPSPYCEEYACVYTCPTVRGDCVRITVARE